MIAPGPNEDQLLEILETAIRVPDHGKLAPWRLVVVENEKRPAFAAMLAHACRIDGPERGRPEPEAIQQFALQAPTLVVVISTPDAASHIPIWEQELSSGALCLNLLHAAHAQGFVGSWLTGWASYSNTVLQALGHSTGRIAGFIFLGTPGRELSERPRPALSSVLSHWDEQADLT